MPGQPKHKTRPHTQLPHSFLGIDKLVTLQMKKATWVIGLLGLYFDMCMYPMGVCTTRHGQTPSRFLQELNICTDCCNSYKQWSCIWHILPPRYRHLIPAPVDRTSAIAWLYKRPWMACRKYQPRTSMTHITCNQSFGQF